MQIEVVTLIEIDDDIADSITDSDMIIDDCDYNFSYKVNGCEAIINSEIIDYTYLNQ